MIQRFMPANHVQRLAQLIERQAPKGDVFVGAAPRSQRKGGKDSVGRVWSLWADCDTEASVKALDELDPAPRYIVATGSGNNAQAWWPLAHWITPETAERLNRRLAHALGADVKVADSARVLRPPGTFNYKHEPPAPVRCLSQLPGFVDPAKIAALPAPPAESLVPRNAAPRIDSDDSLLAIDPPIYVRAMIGREPGRDGKVTCPFHSGGKERTPSLHVYPTAEKGWRCFGCDQGGSIFDFAALLWGIPTRGDDFKRLKERLREELHAG
jgi:hypothetical protein